METETNTQPLTLAEVWRPLMQLCIRLMSKNGRNWLDALNKFLRKEEVWVVSKWKIWALARVGSKKPIKEIINAIISNGYELGDNDIDNLSEIELEFNSKEEDVYLAIVTPKDLGLKPGFTYGKFFEVALKQGLDFCLSGDVFEIVSQNSYKLSQETVSFAMNPIPKMRHRDYFVYYITFSLHYGRDESYNFWTRGLVFRDKLSHPGCENEKFIFRIRKKIY